MNHHFLAATIKNRVPFSSLQHLTLRFSPIPSRDSLRFGTMALRLPISPLPIRSSTSPSWTSPHTIAISSSSSVGLSLRTQEKRRTRVTVRSSSIDAAEVVVGQVTEVNKDTFWPIVKAAGEKAVVLDMYTQWCGPCKVIAPKFQELSKKYLDVVFLKLDCNQENKSLAKELGIRVVPTFKILKDSKIVKEVTGAKLDDLVVAIETVRSS